jgi:hypothetical protein
MGLVKLTNTGIEQVVFTWGGKNYYLDPNGGELIINDSIAKRWLGDWTLKDENEIAVEQRRLKKLHKVFPNPDAPIKVEPVAMSKRTIVEEKDKKPPQKVNPFVKVPGEKEKEFEDLEKLEEEEELSMEEDTKPMDWSSRNKDEAEAEKKAIARKKAKSK